MRRRVGGRWAEQEITTFQVFLKTRRDALAQWRTRRDDLAKIVRREEGKPRLGRHLPLDEPGRAIMSYAASRRLFLTGIGTATAPCSGPLTLGVGRRSDYPMEVSAENRVLGKTDALITIIEYASLTRSHCFRDERDCPWESAARLSRLCAERASTSRRDAHALRRAGSLFRVSDCNLRAARSMDTCQGVLAAPHAACSCRRHVRATGQCMRER